ncbi:MAG: Ig-like domain repeat protein [Candidatus Acidiferrales bacterium]
MRTQPARFSRILLLFAFVSLLALRSFAQTAPAAARITQAVDESQLTVLRGNTYYLAQSQYDRGPAPASLAMDRMLLVLQRGPQQEAALQQLLAQQQDPTSANYHQWLTPQQFGLQFGPADQDIQTITFWLQVHGFQVTRISNGRTVIEFSGTAAQVQEALHTTIHQYEVPGPNGLENHWANSSDPQIPAALTPVVAGVRSLHNFPATPMNHFAGVFQKDKQSGKILPAEPLTIPQFTPGSGCGILGGPCEGLGPYDLAAIYDISPLWSAATPIDGTGQTIAIVGETDINPNDWTSFWNMFGVATPKGTLNIIHDGPDPGFQGDEPEADIDTQWSSAVAKGATIDFVISESTEATLGVDLSAEYIVDNNLAPVMSESYGICELGIGTTGNAYYNALWQQASAQGITVLVSSGDQGSAVCDRGASAAQFGLAVNGFGSTPYNIAVGGTDFNDLTTTSKYWNLTNNTNQANAKGYIPEMTWNDTCTNSEIFPYTGTSTGEETCNNVMVQQEGFLGVEGGSGGASNCTSSNGSLQSSCSGGYAKPIWQAAPGVPSDGKRDVPDVSLFASNGFNGSFYIICQSDVRSPCGLTNGEFLGYGGTSVATPAFAGIMALINQKTGERQGNANYVFYKMAAASSNSCSSSSVPSTGTNNCIFYDTPSGSTIAMACVTGSPNCKTSTSGDQYGVLSGYSTGTGYDLATGLGSVNAANLVNQWSTYAGKFSATKFGSFTLGPPTTITHGQSMPVAASVVPQSGSGTPTGTISLIANTGSSLSDQQGAQQLFTLSSGSLPTGTSATFLPGGVSYSVTAHYSGDSKFAPSDSSPFTVSVNPESSKTRAEILTFNPATGQTTSTNATSFPYGTFYILRSDVTNSGGSLCAPNGNQIYGCPTGTVTLNDTYNGVTGALDGGAFALNAEGYAEDQPIFLMGGQHSIVASYSGDKSYNASSNSSAPDVVTVTQALTTVTLSSGINTIPVGGFPNLNAVISAQAFLPANAPVADYPADSLQFFDGSAKLSGQITYTPTASTSGTAQVTAYITTTTLHVGNNTITAQFLGDPNYQASATSNPVIVDVVIPTTAVVTSSSPTIQHGANVTFTAVITPQQTGSPAMTGTVEFTANAVAFGSATLTNGQAQLTTSMLPGGNLTVIATYSGDTNYQSSSALVSETVNLLASTTTVTTSNAAISQGSSVTLTAQVAPTTAGGPAPTGTLQFYAANSAQGSQYPIGNVMILASGKAQLITTTLSAGTQVVFATYFGDSNYSTSTGSTAEVVSPAPTVTVTASPTQVPISAPGATGSTTITFTGMNGYSGTIPLSPALCSGMPLKTTCSFSASSVVLNSATTTAMVSVTFQTTAASSVFPQSGKRPGGFGWWTLGGILTLACTLCALMLFACFGVGRRRWSMACTILAIAALTAIASCGGGGGGGGGGSTNRGTPVGLDQNVVITFSGAGVTPNPTLNLSINVE